MFHETTRARPKEKKHKENKKIARSKKEIHLKKTKSSRTSPRPYTNKAMQRQKEDANSAEKQLALPKASVKRIMKLSDEIQNVSAEAVVAVAKVTEDFLTKIIHQAHEEATKHNRKTVKVGAVVLFTQVY